MKPTNNFGVIFFTLFLVSVFFRAVLGDVSELNRVFFNSESSGYSYPQPQPPVVFDEPSPLPPIYLPPVFADDSPVFPPSSPAPSPPPPGYLPPSYLPPSSYLPPPGNDVLPSLDSPLPPIISDDSVTIPAIPPPSAGLYPPSQTLVPPQFKIENMSCTQGVNFRATFRMVGDQFPVVEDSSESCITSLSGNMFKIDLESFNNMVKCGVRRCRSGGRAAVQGSESMCVILRMPTVKGLRLPEDGLVTMVCIPQEKVVSQTKHVRLGTNKILQTSRGRSANGVIATGGTQKDLKTRISILRKRPGSNIFDQNVQPDSIIQLGEELLLRAAVNDGDGWKSSHTGPVLITGLNSKKSALLVNQNGCVNPAMRSISPQQPRKINPLGMELHFRAFLFQEAPQGDEMIISVRMQGCLHLQDCLKADFCRDDASTTRSKRELSTSNHTYNKNNGKIFLNESKEVKNWETELSFRVEPALPNRKSQAFVNSKEQQSIYLLYLSLAGVLLFIIFIMLLVLQVCQTRGKGRA